MRLPRGFVSVFVVSMMMGLSGCADDRDGASNHSENATGRGAADSFGAFGGDTRTSSLDSHHQSAGLMHQKPHDPGIPAPVDLNKLQHSNAYYNLRMSTGEVGYRWGYVNGHFAMERTDDRGRTWYALSLPLAMPLSQMTSGTGQLENPSVSVVDPDTVYIFAISGNRLLSLHTDDGGRRWSSKYLPLEQHDMKLESVSVLGDKDAWVLLRGLGSKNREMLYRLQNGATKVTALSIPSYSTAAVRFTNANSGWLVGLTPDGTVNLSVTKNGGGTWATKVMSTPAGLSGWKADRVFQPVLLEGEGNFFVRYAKTKNGVVQYMTVDFRSADGGAHFQTRIEDQLDDAASDFQGTPAYFINSDYGWTVNDQRLTATWDGGMTWRTMHSSSFEQILHQYPRILALNFVTDTAGFALLQSADYRQTELVQLSVSGNTTWADANLISH